MSSLSLWSRRSIDPKCPHASAWEYAFSVQWLELGGKAASDAQLTDWAHLLYHAHRDDDPRAVAASEIAGA